MILRMVGVSGFEPEASWTRTKRDTKLRHTPMVLYYNDSPAQSQERFFLVFAVRLRKNFKIISVVFHKFHVSNLYTPSF